VFFLQNGFAHSFLTCKPFICLVYSTMCRWRVFTLRVFRHGILEAKSPNLAQLPMRGNGRMLQAAKSKTLFGVGLVAPEKNHLISQ
jgi:hypothetical protein